MILFNDLYADLVFEEVFNLFLITGFLLYIGLISSELLSAFFILN